MPTYARSEGSGETEPARRCGTNNLGCRLILTLDYLACMNGTPPVILRVAVKLNFRPYIRRFTSPNENFEYSYPLNMTAELKIRVTYTLNLSIA